MTTIRPQQVVREIRDVLRENLTDLNTRRAENGGSWIWDDFPLLTATLPRIGISQLNGGMVAYSIGTQARRQALIIRIVIVIGTKNTFDINEDDVEENAIEVLDYMSNEVIGLIIDNIDTFRDTYTNLDTMRPINEIMVQTEDRYQKLIDIEILLRRT